MIMTLQEIAARVNGRLQGAAEIEISGVNNITGAGAGDITFADENHVAEAAVCQAGAVLLPKSIAEAQKDFPLPAVFVEDTRAAFAILMMAWKSNAYGIGIVETLWQKPQSITIRTPGILLR